MRDNLVGYLLDALQPDERAGVDAQLSRDPSLRQDLEILRQKLALLDFDRGHYSAPVGLAQRTCDFVASRIDVALTPAAPAPARWRFVDFAVAAAVFLAASTLFLPQLQQSRFAARVTHCSNNLQQLGRSLVQFAHLNGGKFPSLIEDQQQLPAGAYAAKLSQHGLLDEPSLVICPSSNLADDMGRFRVPALQEVESATPDRVADLYRRMGGSYGYNLGYVANGQYQPTRNLGRSGFALMADAPDLERSAKSTPGQLSSFNHGRSGQNVLFEDGHVKFLTKCNDEGCPDHIYLNEDQKPAAGVHQNDAVIGSSSAHPLGE